jgi:hypothetical protein
MRHLHTDSHFRLAIAALQDSGGYVDTLLGLARDQIMARQPLISPRHSRPRASQGARGERARRAKIAAFRLNGEDARSRSPWK